MCHRAVECPNKGWGKAKKGKGKGGQKGWSQGLSTGPTTRACFGYVSTAHLSRDCPKNMNRQVQEVTADEPEVLLIGHTTVEEMEEQWKAVERRKGRKGMSATTD